MADELRTEYHRHLEQIDSAVARMIVLVGESVAAANDALLSGDDQALEMVGARRDEIKELHRTVESLVFTQIARQAPVAGELRFLIGALRIVPEVELTAALTGDIARGGGMHIGAELSPRVRGLTGQLFEHGLAMWRHASDAYLERSAGALDELEAEDEEIDELYASLSAELASGVLRPPVLVEMALVARFLERLGDHAVEVGRWITSFSAAEHGAAGG
ncbi:MAG: phosphate signaling complex PhoU family protein [Acidimicrobiales bacterium]